MDELIAFVTARLDEDEAAAKAAVHSPELPDMLRWEAAAYVHTGVWRIADLTGDLVTEVHAETAGDGEVAQHIARYDPARVLREVEAKRAILELARDATALDMQVDQEFATGPRNTTADPYIGDVILRRLATVWSDHPDYPGPVT